MMSADSKKRISEAKKKYWEKKKATEKPVLPEGVKVGLKPDLFEMYMKGRGTGDKWIVYVKALMALGATETLQFDLANVGDIKKHVRAVIVGIRSTSRMMSFHKKIKSALIGNILHVTV